MNMIKFKNRLVVTCLFAVFSINLSFAQDSLNAELGTEKKASQLTPSIQSEEIKNQLFPLNQPTIDYYSSMKNTKYPIICIIFIVVLLITLVGVIFKIRSIEQRFYENCSTIKDLITKLENKVSKEDFDNFKNEILENIKRINNTKEDSYKESFVKQTESSQYEKKFIPVQEYPIRYFYLDVLNKGWREDVGENIYKCETTKEDPNEAKFEINNLTNTTKTLFFNSGDLNNTSIIKPNGYVTSGKNMTLKKKGILKRNDDGTWIPKQPMEIEFS